MKMKMVPRYTAERVASLLLSAAQASVKDFELCTEIEKLIDEIQKCAIQLSWYMCIDHAYHAQYKSNFITIVPERSPFKRFNSGWSYTQKYGDFEGEPVTTF